MHCALIADIHANLTALDAVLADIWRRGGVDEIWCLGDIVGYGPEPHECLELIRQQRHISVAGNHDLAAVGKLDISNFNIDAATVVRWTAQQLSEEDIKYLEALPPTLEREGFMLTHGSPRDPAWEYITSISSARENFAYFQLKFCLVGHSHIPMIFKEREGGECTASPLSPNIKLILGESRMIINPGAVGQPRDGDPRASYAIYDSEAAIIQLYRVPYDIDLTQNKMVKQNLPMRLVARLGYGQ